LRSAEENAGRKYSLNAIVFWPRLYPLLPDNIKGIVDDQRNQLDIATRLSVIFLLSGIASSILYIVIVNSAISDNFAINVVKTAIPNRSAAGLLISSLSVFAYGLWLIVPLAAFLMAWISYKAAIAAAISYGKGIEVAFDLYRFEIRKALHLPLPKDLREEKVKNIFLRGFLKVKNIFVYRQKRQSI
jgi:hypothetical protein